MPKDFQKRPTASDAAPLIHPTAILENGAELSAGVVIGAYAWIGAGVRLGNGCRVHHHATIAGLTKIGDGCEIFPYACIGLKTQDLKYKGGEPGVGIGRRNVFREFCTVHAATNDGDLTVIGDDNHFLAYSHVAHDCVLGNGVVMSNNATLGGHVIVEDRAIIGGLSGVHQFCRIGKHAMIGGMSKVEKDVPPYLLVDGNPAVVHGLNTVGLRRAGFSTDQISRIKIGYRFLYRESLNTAQAVERLRVHPESGEAEILAFLNFIEAGRRGLLPGARSGINAEKSNHEPEPGD